MQKISCIIINYNNGKYLAKSINSVLNQTLKVYEIIVADDCSTDNSKEIIQSFISKFPNIKAIYREHNLGAPKNRDLAIREAKGDIISTLDSDDWYFQNKIEKEYLALKDQKNAIAISDFVYVDENDETIKTFENQKFCTALPKEQLERLISRKNGLPLQMMFYKSLYLEIGGFKHELSLYEDWDFKIRATIRSVKWVHSGIVGYAYLRIDKGLSSANQLRHIYYKLKVLSSNYENIPHKLSFFKSVFKLFFIKGSKKVFENLF